MTNLIQCDNITLSKSSLCEGNGVFANKNFKKEDLIEKGIAVVLKNVDGHENPHLFTWSNDNPNTKWALLSGFAHFYNTLDDDNSNCIINRDFENNTFTCIAKYDIIKGEELTHTYKSLKWRECFKNMIVK